MSSNSYSNVTGSSSTVDLTNLVNNLINTVNNVQASFSSVQSSITNLNNYDTRNNSTVQQIQVVNTNQEGEIQSLQLDDNQTHTRLSVLEAKFPITNSSILDQTIAESKITGLVSDLANINTNLASLQSQITNLNSQ